MVCSAEGLIWPSKNGSVLLSLSLSLSLSIFLSFLLSLLLIMVIDGCHCVKRMSMSMLSVQCSVILKLLVH